MKLNENLHEESKTFLWKDKTGRGVKNKMTLNEILELENEQDYNDNDLHEWAENAEAGDEWEDRVMKFVCL